MADTLSRIARRAGPRMPSAEPPTVLVVEDDPQIAMMVAEALQDACFRLCGIAGNEDAALHFADVQSPEFAVLDINLGPGGSGLTVGRELHARGVTILYASGSCSDHLAEMERTGARAYLSKPYYPDEVPWALDAVGLLRVGRLPRRVPRAFHVLA